MNKNKIQKKIESYSESSFSSSIDEVISNLQKLKTKATKDGYENIRLEVNSETGYYDYRTITIDIVGDILETDAEAQTRFEKEEQAKNHRRAYEEREFERLKKALGK